MFGALVQGYLQIVTSRLNKKNKKKLKGKVFKTVFHCFVLCWMVKDSLLQFNGSINNNKNIVQKQNLDFNYFKSYKWAKSFQGLENMYTFFISQDFFK